MDSEFLRSYPRLARICVGVVDVVYSRGRGLLGVLGVGPVSVWFPP